MNVLSLFDGMSCGQQALERSGLNVKNYYASEIDKYAISITQKNYPNTIQLGDVVNIDGSSLPKIDLLIGGSPCQSFSFAGKRKGMSTKCEIEILALEHYLKLKNEGYEFEGQSYLFWEFIRILNEVKPTYFLLENVEMGERWELILSKAIGVNGIHINSALVSAQSRKRIYWTNIGMQPSGLFGYLESIITQPKDKKILLKNILQPEVEEKYFLSNNKISWLEKHSEKIGNEFKQLDGNTKSNCLSSSALTKGNLSTDYIVHSTMGRSGDPTKGGTGHLQREDGKCYCLDAANSIAVEERTVKQLNTNNKSNNGTQPFQGERVYSIDGISPSLQGQLQTGSPLISINKLNENQLKKFDTDIDTDKCAALSFSQFTGGNSNEFMKSISKIAKITSKIRKLTPVECERLQTVKDNYTQGVSDTQRYRMLGNGWTVDVISHIFNYIK